MYNLLAYLFWSEPIYMGGRVKKTVRCSSAAFPKK